MSVLRTYFWDMRVVKNVLTPTYRLEVWETQRRKFHCDVLPRGSNEPIHTTPVAKTMSKALADGKKWLKENRP